MILAAIEDVLRPDPPASVQSVQNRGSNSPKLDLQDTASINRKDRGGVSNFVRKFREAEFQNPKAE
jgi:hypothetical protein